MQAPMTLPHWSVSPGRSSEDTDWRTRHVAGKTSTVGSCRGGRPDRPASPGSPGSRTTGLLKLVQLLGGVQVPIAVQRASVTETGHREVACHRES